MSSIPEDLKYSRDHEWIKVEGDYNGICGITDHAQELLTDIVFVELPEPGTDVKKGEQVAVVESVKAVSDIFTPVSGRITEVNKKLEDSPDLVNSDPYGNGWIFKIEVSTKAELDDLMNAEKYSEHVEAGE